MGGKVNDRNEFIGSYLKRMAASGDVPHALLFYGSNETARKEYAMDFIKLLHCSFPQKNAAPCLQCDDCTVLAKGSEGASLHTIFVGPDENSNEITIPKIRAVQAFVSRSSFKEGFKTVLIDRGDRLNREAAAALLKLLEEPRGKTCVILLAERLFLIPATVRSRLVPVRFVLEEGNPDFDDSYKNIFEIIVEMVEASFLKRMMMVQDVAAKANPILFCDALILFLNGALAFYYKGAGSEFFSGLTRSFKTVHARLGEEKIIALLKEVHTLRRVQDQGIAAFERTLDLIVSKL